LFVESLHTDAARHHPISARQQSHILPVEMSNHRHAINSAPQQNGNALRKNGKARHRFGLIGDESMVISQLTAIDPRDNDGYQPQVVNDCASTDRAHHEKERNPQGSKLKHWAAPEL